MTDEKANKTLSLATVEEKPKPKRTSKKDAAETKSKPKQGPQSDDLATQIDAVAGRLEEGAAACLKSWTAWADSGKPQAQSDLGEAVHNLRRVLARIDIIMAKANRQNRDQKKIPIPKHRSA